ncbi:MAG: hypothetical protein AUJ12_06035 [Alphaproteobacteria bacterium CG1_02_46_17]|nr:MAG: hypothetical protein AUJ12_06035 [Alphaproteobacteria bacterium CG1_02_46_17]
MNSTVFAAYAAKPVSHAGLNEGRLLETILKRGADKGHTDGLLNPEISKDVRTLVGMHDRGRIKSFEVKDTSYKALLSLAKYLDSILGAPRTDGLAPELLAQAVRFIKTVPAAQVFLRLEITDKKPDVPDYNPAHMCAYDADRSYGTDYLQIARRLTIHGSTSSVMNNTDLGTFLESGRKKCVVLYLGTQKNDDVQFLDPSHSLALDLVVEGIENYENLDALTEKVETLLNYPELIQLHEEVAELQILLTEFKNNLNIETGNDLVDRLTDLKNKIGHMSDNDELIDLLAPIAEMTSFMLGGELVHEILMLRDNMPETLAPTFPEIEDIHTALQSIINNPELSSEDRQAKIIALLQAEMPDILGKATLSTMFKAICHSLHIGPLLPSPFINESALDFENRFKMKLWPSASPAAPKYENSKCSLEEISALFQHWYFSVGKTQTIEEHPKAAREAEDIFIGLRSSMHEHLRSCHSSESTSCDGKCIEMAFSKYKPHPFGQQCYNAVTHIARNLAS